MAKKSFKTVVSNAAKPKLDRGTTERLDAGDDGFRGFLASFIRNEELLDVLMAAHRKPNGGQGAKAPNTGEWIEPFPKKRDRRSTPRKTTDGRGKA